MLMFLKNSLSIFVLLYLIYRERRGEALQHLVDLVGMSEAGV